MPKLLTKKGQDATDENYFIGGTVERLRESFTKVSFETRIDLKMPEYLKNQ